MVICIWTSVKSGIKCIIIIITSNNDKFIAEYAQTSVVSATGRDRVFVNYCMEIELLI